MATPQPAVVAQALPALAQAANLLRAASNDQSTALAAAVEQMGAYMVNLQTQVTTHVQDNLAAHDELQKLINGLQNEVGTLRTQHDALQTALTNRFVPLETRASVLETGMLAQTSLTSGSPLRSKV